MRLLRWRKAGAQKGALALRVISILLLAPAFLWVTAKGGAWFFGLVGAMAVLAVHELANMASFSHRQLIAGQLMMLSIFVGLGLQGLRGLALGFALVPFICALSLLGASPEKRTLGGQDLWVLYGATYWSFCLGFMVLVRGMPEGRVWMLGLLTLVWSQDSFAYLVGKAFGRHKLAPSVSPNKTWEGTLGGLVLGLATTWAILSLGFGVTVTVSTMVAFGFAAVAGQVGDLAESLVKRHFNCKDSGNLIPGHGGVLDRFDSLSFAAPVFYVAFAVTTFASIN